MNKDYTKEQIKNILQNELFNKNYNFNYEKVQPANCFLANMLNKYFKENYPNLFRNRSEILYCYKNKDNVDKIINDMFCYCGKRKRFHSYKKGYKKYCSSKCFANDKSVILNRINLMRIVDKNGLSGFDRMSLKVIKTSRSNIDKNGLNSYQRAVINRKRTNKLKNNDENWNNRPLCYKTKLEKYGDKNYNNRIKAKQTNLKKYNFDCYAKTDKYKSKYSNILFLFKRELKRAFTCYLKYNKMYYLETDICREKSILSKNNNSTFNTSKPEKRGFNKLLIKFPDAIHHYAKDPRYPFECDMYIPSQDLFIECHYFWTHGDPKYNCHEPFNKNNPKHLEVLQRWKNKDTKFYQTAIKVWTYYDPLKLKTFQDNKLNYKIFYKEEDFNKWLDNI